MKCPYCPDEFLFMSPVDSGRMTCPRCGHTEGGPRSAFALEIILGVRNRTIEDLRRQLAAAEEKIISQQQTIEDICCGHTIPLAERD